MSFKTSSSSTFISLDGVPFAIGEKFHPPKKVTLPIHFETGNVSEIIFMEYDSTLEESFLAKCEVDRIARQEAFEAAQRKSKREALEAAAQQKARSEALEAAAQQQAAMRKASEDAAAQQKSADSKLPDSSAHQVARGLEFRNGFQSPESSSDVTSSQPSCLQSSDRTVGGKPIQAGFVYNNFNNSYNTNSDILVPTRVNVSQGSKNGTGNRSNDVSNSIDLKDFERELDPFENLSLKVINDKEELDRVFLATSRVASGLPSQPYVSYSSNSTTVNNVVRGPGLQNQYTATNLTGSNSSAPAAAQFDNNFTNTGLASSNWYQTPNHIPTLPQHPAAVLPSDPITNTSSYQMPAMAIQPAPCSEFPAPNYTSQQFRYQDLLQKSADPSTGNGAPSLHSLNFERSIAFDHKQQTNQFAGHSCVHPSLRSTKSTPDITNVDENLSATVTPFGRYTPPPHPQPKLPLGNVSGMPVNSRHTSSDVSKPVPSAESVAYLSLPVESRRYVDSVVVMGFDQDLASRAVDHFGKDEKKVLEHLCLLSNLSEKGYNSHDSQMALFLFDDKIEKTEAYLGLLTSFRSMGFSVNDIKDALLKSDLDEDKALDLLVSGF